MAKLSIRHLVERPKGYRWEPSPGLRRAGFNGRDLTEATRGLPGNGGGRNTRGGGADAPLRGGAAAAQWISLGDAILEAERLNAEADAWRSGSARPAPRGLDRDPRCCEKLWEDYTRHETFTRLAATTRMDYRRKIRVFLDGLPAGAPPRSAHRRAGVPLPRLYGYGDVPAHAIDKPAIDGFATQLLSRTGLSMRNGVIAVARRVLSHAERIGWRPAQSNPAFQLDLTRPDPRLRLLLPHEIAAWVATCDRAGRHSVGDAVVLALHSGQRQSDVLSMGERIVDEGRVRIHQDKTSAAIDVRFLAPVQARLNAARARKRSLRVVPSHLEGREAKKAQRRAIRLASVDEIVFNESDGRRYQSDFFRHLAADMRLLAIKDCPSLADATFADLRDTAVTRLALAGCTKWQIASVTGHSFGSIDTILKHYLLLTQDMADSAIAQLEAWMEREGIAL